MKIYDVSAPIHSETVVWQGDARPLLGWSATRAETGSVNVGKITLSTHTATHADAPLHFSDDGRAIHELPLDVFVGPACVVARPGEGPIRPEELGGLDLGRAPRWLFRTRRGAAPTVWDPDFRSFAPETIERLGDAGVCLVGIDTPSVDPADSKGLPAHHALARRGIVNLENLVLAGVPEGRYFLVALPLALVGMDASPVRAVLLPDVLRQRA